jgi:glucose/arabinose dehydrogenase
MRKTALLTATFALVLFGASSASAQSVQLVPFGGEEFSSPTYVAAPPGDSTRVFVVENGGGIRLVKNGVAQGASFLDINSDVLDFIERPTCECGLYSMAFAPDYATSGRFYVYYTHDIDPGLYTLRIEEFKRSASNPDLADPGSGRIVLDIPVFVGDDRNGGQLQFGPDKRLYAAIGDGNSSSDVGGTDPQDPGSLLGKLLRIDPNGPVQIYSSGLRNPYRFSFDRSTGDLTLGDVGQNSWEELNFKPEGAASGANFGWDCFEGHEVFSGCSVPNHSPPVLVYPNSGSGTAVNGGYVIRDSALPTLRGRYIYADTFDGLGGQIHTVVLGPGGASGDGPVGLSAELVVSFGQDACGHIYVATLGGTVFRLEPTSGGFPCKLAPVLTVFKKSARRAARKGAVVIRALCDEDCDLTAQATILLKGGGEASSAKRGRKGRGIRAKVTRTRLQLGQKTKLKLDLSKKRTKLLRKALARERKAVAKIKVSATGGGGGTATVKRRVKQRR